MTERLAGEYLSCAEEDDDDGFGGVDETVDGIDDHIYEGD
jgi:hypothetical protein